RDLDRPVLVELDDHDLGAPLELRVHTVRPVRVDVPAGTAVDTLEFHDAAGQPVDFLARTKKGLEGRFDGINLAIVPPGEPFRVSELATHAVLLRGDEEVQRGTVPAGGVGETVRVRW
ncbi:MAG: hypothetical protein ACF8LK_04130, partial [Phycisphaerales bacterium JB041]